MKCDYINFPVDINTPDFVSLYDEIPFWSAKFGIDLLEKIRIRKNINVLDIGCGTGFPLIEIAMRLGSSCRIHGLDTWPEALERAKNKIETYSLKNVELHRASAQKMPFNDEYFDLIVSNNGLNNVTALPKVLKECGRIAAPAAQLIFSMNTDDTMNEFYTLFRKILKKINLQESIYEMDKHIKKLRPSYHDIINKLEKVNFNVHTVYHDYFRYQFNDAESFFNHRLIKTAFLPAWEEILPDKKDLLSDIFYQLEEEINREVLKKNFFQISIPYVIIDATKKETQL